MNYDHWKATDPRIERDGERAELDEPPVYRLTFQAIYPTGVRVLFERYDAVEPRTWIQLMQAEGCDERDAISALRARRHAFAAELKRSRAEQAEADERHHRYLRSAGINPRHGVYGGGR